MKIALAPLIALTAHDAKAVSVAMPTDRRKMKQTNKNLQKLIFVIIGTADITLQ